MTRLTAPMTVGMLGMIVFNLTDTYFVGQLGSLELAALFFTFPVVMVIGSVAHGLGTGITAAVSRAAGEHDSLKIVRTTIW